jgi:tetratricopeptide (TPR) repeat protein
VFPTIEGTSIIWGLLAVILVGILVYENKQRSMKNVLAGIAWFVLFLLPIFFVPKNINDQLFEHRLYLPMLGILLLLRETGIFTSAYKIATRQAIAAVVIAMCIISIHVYTPSFADTFSFWNNAVEASPENAYANKLLGIKLSENKREKEAVPYIQKAWSLDTNENYTRLFLARLIHMPRQQWDSARYYLEREVEVNPRFSDTYAELAQVCVAQKDLPAAEKNLRKFLEYKPGDQLYNTNLLLIYKDQRKYNEGLSHAEVMKARGLDVNPGLYKLLQDSSTAKPYSPFPQ